MPRRSTAKAAQNEDQARGLAIRDFAECVKGLDLAQVAAGDAKAIMDAMKEAAEAKGFDAKLLDQIRKLKNKVDDGKVTLAAAQAKITNTQLYAEAIGLMDQGNLFGEAAGTEPEVATSSAIN